MANIARLGVVLGLNTAEFQTGLAGAMKGLDKLKTGVVAAGAAVGAAAAGIATYTKKTIDNMDALAKQAQMAGVTVESLSGLSYAADLAGVSQEQLTTSMGRLAKGMGEASQGTGEALKGFQALNLDPATFKGTDDALTQIAEKLSQFKDGAEKTAIAISIFGRSGAQLIPFLNAGKDGIKQLTDEARQFGIIVGTDTAQASERFNDNLTRIQAVGKGLFIQIAESWLPTLNNLTEGFINATKQSGSFFGSLTATAERAVFGKSSNAVKEIERLQKEINDINKIYPEGSALSRSIWDKSLAYSKARIATLQTQVNDELNAAFPKELLGYTPPPKLDAPKLTGTDPNASKMANMLASVRKISDEFNRSQEAQLKMLAIQDKMASMTNNERAVQEAINGVLNETNSQLEKIASKRLEAANAGANTQVLEQFDLEAQAVKELSEGWARLTKEQKEASIEAQQTFSFGWNQAFRQYAEDSQNYATVARDMFSAVTGSMSRAIDQFVESGKFSFKDFAGSVIKDLIKIQLQAQATALFNKGLNLVMGAVSMYSGGGFGTGNQFGNMDIGGFLAEGGSASAGEAYVVGERGAELFVPDRSGTVIPNNQLGGLGGVTNITNNYIDAIDTKSFEDRIYGSSRAVWAANQYANKGLTNNRSRT